MQGLECKEVAWATTNIPPISGLYCQFIWSSLKIEFVTSSKYLVMLLLVAHNQRKFNYLGGLGDFRADNKDEITLA